MNGPSISIEDDLSSEDLDRLFHWRAQVFPADGKAFTWAAPDKHVVARLDGSAIAHLGFGVYPIRSQDAASQTVGVGGVVVRPEHQGRGIPGLLFEEVHAYGAATLPGIPFSLFCPASLVPYYERHGYVPARQEVAFMQNDRLATAAPLHFMARGMDLSEPITVLSEPW